MRPLGTFRTRFAVAVALALVGGCSDSTAPSRQPGDLNILRLLPSAPPLLATSVTFQACRGSSAEGRLFFASAEGGEGEEFAELQIGSNSLATRPDGTPFQPGDCVQITMSMNDPQQVLVQLEPTGLTFNPADPPRLRLDYGEAEGVTPDVESQIGIWRQETPDQPFVRIGSATLKDLKEVEARLSGFSRYALAY